MSARGWMSRERIGPSHYDTMLVHRPAGLGQFITEDWPIEPTWAYSESKVRTRAAHSGSSGAKAGAWLMGRLPGADPFIRPWMIDRANDHYALDITRARTVLGWEPKRSLRDTIPRMIDALKADPVAWYRDNDLEPPSDLPAKANSTSRPFGESAVSVRPGQLLRTTPGESNFRAVAG